MFTSASKLQNKALPPDPITDPNYASVVFLCHMDGADGSTTFTDVKGKTITNANVTVSTANPKFAENGLFNGTNAKLTLPAHADFNFTGDFTIEGWFYSNAITGSPDIISNMTGGGGATADWTLVRASASLQWYPSTASAAISKTIAANQWYHVALVRVGTTCQMFVDGISAGTMTVSGAIGDSTRNVFLGSRAGTGGFWNGRLDEWRITKGVGRYTGNFIPRRSAFPETA